MELRLPLTRHNYIDINLFVNQGKRGLALAAPKTHRAIKDSESERNRL
jgi:hypothetical protein